MKSSVHTYANAFPQGVFPVLDTEFDAELDVPVLSSLAGIDDPDGAELEHVTPFYEDEPVAG